MNGLPVIIDVYHPAYQLKRKGMWAGRHNGAYYYSKEIRELLIPKVKTDRNWITINIPPYGADHSIVFVHNNLNPDHYDWLARYKDLILVCGVPKTCSKVAHLGKTIYLPLPIDEANVAQYIVEKDKDVCYAGRASKFAGKKVSGDPLCNLPREELLKRMAHYKKVYAVGRTAIEARILGLEVLPYDPRYPSPDIWKVFTYEDAAARLQKELDMIDFKEEAGKQITPAH